MLRVLTEHVHQRLKATETSYVWLRTDETDDDLKAIREAGGPSEFDPLRLRQGLFEALQEGQAILQSRILVKRGSHVPLAKVIVIHQRNQEPNINWKLWRKIFCAFGLPAGICAGQGNLWRVVFFCAKSPRRFPPPGREVGAANVNGGYAYPNQPMSIVIYREEEAARVLVHELLHACGSDEMGNPEWKREVLTESWAELFLIAVQAGGSVSKGEALWNEQAQWILCQELLLTRKYGVRTPADYAFRYTVGRRAVMEKWGLRFPDINYDPREVVGESLRFTAPVLTGDV